MSLEYTVNFYDTRAKDWRNALIGFFARSNITHCGLQVTDDNNTVEYTCVEKSRGISIIDPKWYAKMCCTPVHSIKLGIIDSPLPTIPENFKITATGHVLYHLIGRYLHTPMPDGCATYVSEILVEMGILNNRIFYPEELYKELNRCK